MKLKCKVVKQRSNKNYFKKFKKQIESKHLLNL